MVVRAFILGAILCLSNITHGLAQARTEDPRATSQLHIGALYLKPAINLRELGIDTNVFNESEGAEKDFTFTVTPALTTSVPIASRALLQLQTGLDVVYYQKHASERSLNPDVSFRGEIYLNRVALFVKPSYLRTRERPSLEIDRRSQRVEQGTAAGGEIRIFPKFVLEGSVLHLRTTYDADEFFLGNSLSEMLNRENWTSGGAARWIRTPLTTFVLRGDIIRDRFLHTPNRNADSVRTMAGVELKPRALISGNGYVGIQRFEPRDVRVPPFTGVVASAGLSYSLLGTMTFGLNVNRDVNYSYEPDQPYYVATGFGGTVQRHLIARFDAMIGFDRSVSVYRSRAMSLPIGGNGNARDITDNYSGSIGYRVGRNGRLGAGISYWMRNSERDDSHDYRGVRFRSSLTYGL